MAADEDSKGTGKAADSGNGKPGDARAGERRQRERRRTPVTIDLKAEPVRPEPVKSQPPSAEAPKPEVQSKPEAAVKPESAEPPRPPQGERVQPEQFAAAAQRSSRARAAFAGVDDLTRRTIVAGVAGGIAALVLVIVLQAIGLLPAPGRSAANAAAEQARAAAEATSSLERRLTAIEAMVEGLPTMRADLASLGTSVTALRAETGAFAAKTDLEGVVTVLGQLRQRVDALPPSASRDDLDALTERIGRLEVTVAAGGGDSAGSDAAIASLAGKLGDAETALRSLTERLASAEAQMASLGTPQPMAGGEAAVRAIAITALRRASEGGEPFVSEVDMVAALGVSGDDVGQLRPFAETGVPAKSALVAEFPAVADAILSATAAGDPDAGFLQRIVAGLGGLVSIRPAGPVAGTDPPAIVSRMIASVGKGDLAAALAERDGLPDAGRAVSAEWAVSAEKRVALDALVERIARALGGVSSG